MWTLVVFLETLSLKHSWLIDASIHHQELFDRPVEHVIILKAFMDEQIAEELAEVGVVGSVFKLQSLDIFEVARKCIREATAEILNCGTQFLLFDKFISPVFCRSLHTLPR